MRKLAYIAVILLLFESAVALLGRAIGPGALHPMRLNPDRAAETQAMLDRAGATKVEFDVRAPDGIELRG